jgi:hypothetical protein
MPQQELLIKLYEWTIVCNVQDNFVGENILEKKVKMEE